MAKKPIRYNRIADARKQGANQDIYPISAADVRKMTLEVAGFDPEFAGRVLKRAAEKMIEKLDATKTQFFAHEGEVISEREVVDHSTQLKAAEDLADLGMDVMGLRRRATDDKPTPPSITFDLSGWTISPPVKDETKDVTPPN